MRWIHYSLILSQAEWGQGPWTTPVLESVDSVRL
jgi:hypothetical protein